MIIIFDDVQWASDLTMYAIKSLIQNSNAFFILSYRSGHNNTNLGENYDTIPYFLNEDFENTPEYFNKINLNGLSLTDVQKLTSDMMGCNESMEDLASVIHIKTKGNPFFIIKVSLKKKPK